MVPEALPAFKCSFIHAYKAEAQKTERMGDFCKPKVWGFINASELFERQREQTLTDLQPLRLTGDHALP